MQWKQHVRKIFRDEIRAVIEKEFKIYAMRARLGVDGVQYLQQHFYELNGRVFQPYGEERSMFFAYARPAKKMAETQGQYDELAKYFVIQPCNMGQDPLDILKTELEQELKQPVITPQWLTVHYLERDLNRGVLVGYYKNKEQLQWILGNNDKGTLVYNVRLHLQSDKEVREGAHTEGFYKNKNIQFVILYTDGVESTGEYRVFHVKDTAGKVTEERMRNTWYPLDVKGNYFFFRFDEEVSIGRLKIKELLENLKTNHLAEFGSYTPCEPMFTTAKEVLAYRNGF